MTRIAVIGAGALGLSCAMALSKKGERDVTVIDRSYVAAGASSLSAGIYLRQYPDAPDVAIRAESYEIMCELERLGLVLHRVGFLWLAHDDAALETAACAIELQRDMGITDATVLDRDGLTKAFPLMYNGDLSGAGFTPSDGYLDGQQLCMMYAEAAERGGVRMYLNDELLGAESTASGAVNLRTRKRTIECDVVVNAAGMWAPQVGEILGAPVAITPMKHDACIFELDTAGVELACTMDTEPAFEALYFRPEGVRQIVVGLEDQPTSDPLESPEHQGHEGPDEPDYIERVSSKLADRLPSLSGMGFVTKWFGYYPVSPTGKPTIAPASENPAVFNLVGFGGNGVHLSPAAGKHAADLIVDGKSSRSGDWAQVTS
jgi:glycine/D-amino acid oxidase-like deaminating enzyme